MLRKITLIATISVLIFLTGNLSAQNNSLIPVQKTGRIKLLETKDFKHTDVGNPAIPGTVTVSEEGFDITAGGADVWGVKDEFNFVYIEKTGDFDFAARIESLTSTHLYTKAGLMARQDLTPGSRHIYFQVFPNNNPRNKNNGGFEYQYRQITDGEMKAIYPAVRLEGTPDFPVTFPNTWIRLKRIGDKFIGYASTDGISWKEYATFTLNLPEKVYLGIAVTSHKTTEYSTAKFRNIGNILK
jgi:regulation of enolase protein 1 (concanavalin A-like superfamily)